MCYDIQISVDEKIGRYHGAQADGDGKQDVAPSVGCCFHHAAKGFRGIKEDGCGSDQMTGCSIVPDKGIQRRHERKQGCKKVRETALHYKPLFRCKDGGTASHGGCQLAPITGMRLFILNNVTITLPVLIFILGGKKGFIRVAIVGCR